MNSLRLHTSFVWLLLSVFPALLSAQPVWQSSVTAVGTAATATVAIPASTVAGDLLVIGLMYEKGNTVAITPPAGWTLIQRTDAGTNTGMVTYFKVATASEPASYGFALTNTPKWSIGISRITGVNADVPVFAVSSAIASSSSTSVPSSSINAVPAYSMVLSFHSNKTAATFTPATGTTERYDAPNTSGGLPSNMMATFATTTGGATTARSATANESEVWVAQQVVIASGNTQTYTSGNATFTVPIGVTEITVEAWGGGGGGGRGSGANTGNGAGGGAYARRVITSVLPGQEYTVEVGSGGLGSDGNNRAGSPGQGSVFGSGLLTAQGGDRGGNGGSNGAGGSATTGTGIVSFAGGTGASTGGGGAAGTSEAGSNAAGNTGGFGGSLFGGNGGNGPAGSGAGYGGGGAGASGQSATIGDGANGAIRVTFSRGELLLSQPLDAVVGSRVAYVVSRVNASGSPITSGSLTLDLSRSPILSSAQFFAAPSGGSAITSITIPNGSSSATFYFTASVANTYDVTVSSTLYASVTDDIQFFTAPATQFLITQTNGQPIGPQLRNIPFSIRVTLADQFGNAVSNTGGTTTITLSAAGGATAGALQFSNNPGATVTASLSAGASSVTLTNVLYTGLSSTAGLDVVISAIGSVAGDGNGKTGQSNPFSVRDISLTVVAGNASIVANGVSTTSITVTLSSVGEGGALSPIVGETVRVGSNFGILIREGNAVLQETAFTTDAQGQVLFTLRSGTVIGTATVQALCPGSCPASTTVQFIAGAASTSTSVISASKVILSGDANNADILSVLTLRLRDAFGNPTTTTSAIAFTSTLGSVIDAVQNLGSGVYRATLTAQNAGIDQVGATIGGAAIDAKAEIRILPIEQYRTKQSGVWNDPTTWERILPSGVWQNTQVFPQAVSSESVILAPIVAGLAASSSPFPTTSHGVALPAGISSGDRLLLFWSDASTTTTVTTPSGWSVLSTSTVSGYRRIVFEKTASGSETRILTVTTSAAERSAHVVVAIAAGSYDGATVVSTLATGTSASPDAPSLTSGFGSVATLWLAASFSSGDDNNPLPSGPSSFSGLVTGYAGDGTAFARMAVANQTLSASTNDPSAFTLGSSVTWAAATVAIRGATVVVSPSATSALIRDSHTVTLATNQPMDQVIVASGGTIAFQGENAFTGLGPFVLQAGGTLRITSIDGITTTANTGNIRFTGVQGALARSYASNANYVYEATVAQVTGSGLPAEVNSLTVTNTNGVQLGSNLKIIGRLSLPGGVLVVPADRVLDIDGFAGTTPAIESGRILLESGAIYRNLTVQRPRIEARRLINGLKGWRMVSSPLNTTYGQLFSGFVTQGFAGSAFPSLQTNLMWWDESDRGTTLQGWRKPTTLTDSVAAGRGHFHYVFNGAQRPDQPIAYDDALPKLMSVVGFEHPFNAAGGTRFQWPLTFSSRDTASQTGTNYVDRVTADAGWNLIGNPTASTLNWNDASAWTKTGLSSTIYVWDASIDDYRVWNGTSGNLLSGRIAPYQAFWVKTTSANPVLNMTAAAKSTQAATFRGKEQDTAEHDASVMTFTLDADGRQSQTWLQFSDAGRLGYDAHDAFRLSSPNNSWVTLHTRAPSADAAPMQINHLPAQFDAPVHLDLEIGAVRDLAPVSGTFSLSWKRPENWDESIHVVLMDHETRSTTALTDSGSVTFDYETPRSFAAKTAGGESLELPASPVAGSEGRAKLSETAYSRQTRFSLMVSNEPLEQYLPRTIALDQNYPNPFNPSTVIRFHLPESQAVRVDVFDVLGRHIATLADGEFGAGSHQLNWNAGSMAGGVYLYRLSTRTEVITQKMTLLK